MFAIIEIGGKQYKVEKGLKFEVEKLDLPENEELKVEKVLMIEENNDAKIGRPYLNGSSVTLKVIGQTRGEKVNTIKMKPKKRYIRHLGHKQHYTMVEVTEIK
ncbi:MAG: 50S ribosomal protein L21 [Candidatus Gracilibacteria bacterium]|jgi:large subunit ribosomal protein L21|nr:50S ribosomal protein L21 [Candidatus Gracilibacteria bacterium]